jgi:hypothetical protein
LLEIRLRKRIAAIRLRPPRAQRRRRKPLHDSPLPDRQRLSRVHRT